MRSRGEVWNEFYSFGEENYGKLASFHSLSIIVKYFEEGDESFILFVSLICLLDSNFSWNCNLLELIKSDVKSGSFGGFYVKAWKRDFSYGWILKRDFIDEAGLHMWSVTLTKIEF